MSEHDTERRAPSSPQDGSAQLTVHSGAGKSNGRQRPTSAALDGFDWPSIRDMVRAPAYYARAAASTTTLVTVSRGLDVEERAGKVEAGRANTERRKRWQP